MSDETRQCTRCGRVLPLTGTHFYFRKDRGVWEMPCLVCRAELKRELDRVRASRARMSKDWATLYRGTLLPAQLRGWDDPARDLTSNDLRVIMHFQHDRCPFTREPLVLPTPEDVRKYSSWLRWQKTLSTASARRVPVLVPADMRQRAACGNLLFISVFLEELYTVYGGAVGLRRFMEDIVDGEPPICLPPDEHVRLHAELTKPGPEVEENKDEEGR